MKCRRIAGLLLWAAAIPAVADTATAAVAANFTSTAQALAARFEALTGHRLVMRAHLVAELPVAECCGAA